LELIEVVSFLLNNRIPFHLDYRAGETSIALGTVNEIRIKYGAKSYLMLKWSALNQFWGEIDIVNYFLINISGDKLMEGDKVFKMIRTMRNVAIKGYGGMPKEWERIITGRVPFRHKDFTIVFTRLGMILLIDKGKGNIYSFFTFTSTYLDFFLPMMFFPDEVIKTMLSSTGIMRPIDLLKLERDLSLPSLLDPDEMEIVNEKIRAIP